MLARRFGLPLGRKADITGHLRLPSIGRTMENTGLLSDIDSRRQGRAGARRGLFGTEYEGCCHTFPPRYSPSPKAARASTLGTLGGSRDENLDLKTLV